MRYNSTQAALRSLWRRCQNMERAVHAPFLVLWTKTRPKLLKKNRETGEACPYPAGVERLAQRYGQIGCSYQNCTNNLIGRMDDPPLDDNGDLEWFLPQALWGGKGEHVPDDPFLVRHVEHGTLYLCFKPRQKPSDGSIMIGADQWTDIATGSIIEVPKDYLPLERPLPVGRIPWRTIELGNVVMFQCGEIYEIAA